MTFFRILRMQCESHPDAENILTCLKTTEARTISHSTILDDARQVVPCGWATPGVGIFVRVCANVHRHDAGARILNATMNHLQPCRERSLVSFKQSAGENRLVATLTGPDRQRLFADFDQVELHSAEVICRSGERMRHVYFPTDGIVSLVTSLPDGSRLEVGSIGHEGMLGSSLVLGVDTSAQHAIIQRSGTAWRLDAGVFQRHLRKNIALRRLLNSYMYVLMGQLAQTTACSHYHQVRARLARRLLINRDQVRGNQFHVTQEFLAHMLGVRRVGITNAANSLREQGLIDYRRGVITILDGSALELASCACYRGANDMYERALGSFQRRSRIAGNKP